MFNDVRKSDASQRVAARTDFFGRTNQACWEQAANDAAAHVELAQTADVRSIVGTIVTTDFTDDAAAVNSPSPNTTRGDAMQLMRCFGPNTADARTSRRTRRCCSPPVHPRPRAIVTIAFTNAAAAVNSPSRNATRGDAMQSMRCFGPNAADARTSRRGATEARQFA